MDGCVLLQTSMNYYFSPCPVTLLDAIVVCRLVAQNPVVEPQV